ncbi:hypothetical protein [Cupriavidus sp. RAF12]|uniref:hypothetical protein n=1 Tax=Cupriavidus sp. RAF12 TaxID=3233050 RepID=UPI003F8E390C
MDAPDAKFFLCSSFSVGLANAIEQVFRLLSLASCNLARHEEAAIDLPQFHRRLPSNLQARALVHEHPNPMFYQTRMSPLSVEIAHSPNPMTWQPPEFGYTMDS